jgi:TetR/AcrR family transcriptional repressor of nem operon
MPWPTEKKTMSRERILECAVRLFSARGFDDVTIVDVMTEAQLTNGAFYAHFSSKLELYTEAIAAATKDSILTRIQEESGREDFSVTRLLTAYLSVEHVEQRSPACPLAFLATDVATRKEGVRYAYTKVFNDLIYALNKQLDDLPDYKNRVLAISALMIGGVAISRALNDEQSVIDLLGACKAYSEELLCEKNAET